MYLSHALIQAIQTPVGLLPDIEALDLSGLDISRDTMKELLKYALSTSTLRRFSWSFNLCRIDPNEWLQEVRSYRNFHSELGSRVPKSLWQELDGLGARVQHALSQAH
jgi:phosphoenolpyruvate carboxykinase (GTP)